MAPAVAHKSFEPPPSVPDSEMQPEGHVIERELALLGYCADAQEQHGAHYAPVRGGSRYVVTDAIFRGVEQWRAAYEIS